ncbi:3008_t:CDS:1 [Acaulospora morrowiae]|uniref:3008_t:CDS:1 n=1 Tax=Acaulospora morrowiae TaxID=94023 RepID=A0A9N9CCZ3_9GLOM|nr:3008_t:CDS:1 [Acaulospora morrowiae]
MSSQHQKSKISCIIYLEPSSTSRFYQSIANFYDQTLKLFGPNEALKYHPHVSMTGFFNLYDGPDKSSHEKLDKIIKFINSFLESHKGQITHPKIEGIIRSRAVLISINVCQALHELVGQISLFDIDDETISINNHNTKILIRPKRIDHISLAYCSHTYPEGQDILTEDVLAKIEAMAHKMIDFSDMEGGRGNWDLVVYEKTIHGSRLEDKHIFREIGRWNIV